jgi:hypothetical protein
MKSAGIKVCFMIFMKIIYFSMHLHESIFTFLLLSEEKSGIL